jgi:hypothetical protein
MSAGEFDDLMALTDYKAKPATQPQKISADVCHILLPPCLILMVLILFCCFLIDDIRMLLLMLSYGHKISTAIIQMTFIYHTHTP